MACLNMYVDPGLQAHQEKIFTESRCPWADVLPPGMDKETFARMCHELGSICGDDNFFTGTGLMHFTDPFYWNERSHLPSAAIW